jgi:hypothetical protein
VYQFYTDELEKFAELIVGECMRMCDVAAIGYESHKHFEKQWVRGEWVNITKQDIKDIPRLVEHFGVEE